MLQLTIKTFDCDEFGYKKADWPEIPYILSICETNHTKHVVHSFLSSTAIDPIPYQKLINKIQRKPPKTLHECIFIATFFTEIVENQVKIIEFIKPIFHKSDILNYILKDSFGKILYNYQLESLYEFANLNDLEGSISFRKSVNKKDTAVIEKFKNKASDNDTTLFNVVQKHLPFGYCYYPNYFGGRVLWELLKY